MVTAGGDGAFVLKGGRVMRFNHSTGHSAGRLLRVLTLALAAAFVSPSAGAAGSAPTVAAAPVPNPAPNMQNAIALPVPYEQAMRTILARPAPQTAAPVVTGGGVAAVHALATAQVSTAKTASSLSCTPPAAAAELVELTRALKYSPDLIYEYVVCCGSLASA